MKNLVLMMLCLMFLSCKKNDFDLATLTFPLEKEAVINKFKVTEGSDFLEAVTYKTKDENALYFGGEKLSGHMVDAASYFGTNHVNFQLIKQTKKIEAYQLSIDTKNEALKLEKALIEKFGKADYHYQKEGMSFRIWEVNQNAYFLEINSTATFDGKPTVSAYLNVVNKKNKLMFDFFTAGGFGYYADYLFEKSKPEHQNQKYSYHDFVNQKQQEDGADSYYVKGFVK